MDNILCIEKVLSWERLLRLVPERDLRLAAALKPASRREEFLMWRSIVYRRLPDAEIAYNAVGAPVVCNYPLHIGVSHCPGYVAVCFSDRPCAVDIEPLARDFGRAAVRFASAEERQLSDSPLLLPALWCAKETLYKYSGRRNLDLLRDLRIERFRSGRRPDDGSYLRGIRIGNRTSEGGGASCSLYLGVIMLAGVIRFGTFGVSVVL